MRRIQFALPERTILLNRWQRMNRFERTRYSRALAWQVRVALQATDWRLGDPPKEHSRIEVYRYSTQYPDWDGLLGGLKPLLDCLVMRTKRNPHGLGVVRDDSPKHLMCPAVYPVIGTPSGGLTRIFLQETAKFDQKIKN